MTLKTKIKGHQDCQQWLTMLLITTGMTAGLAGHQLVGQADTGNEPDNATSGQPEQVVPGSEQPKEVTLSQTSGQGSQPAAASGTSQASATAGSAQSMQSSGVSSVGSAMPSEAGGAVSDQSNNERSAASVPTSVSSAGGQLTSDSSTKPVSSAASVSSAAPASDKPAANDMASNRLRSNLQQSRMAAVTVDTPELTLPTNGVYGTANWDIDTAGVLTIHAGQTGNATIVKPTWGGYDERITSVVVEDGVVAAPDATGLFANLKNATTIDLTKLDTSKTWNMSRFFADDDKLNKLNLTNLDTSQVNDMSHMFDGCRLLPTIDVSNFDTSRVTDMSYMFSNCGDYYAVAFPVIKYSDKFVTDKVTNMSHMFYESAFKTIAIIKNFDTVNVTNMADMFAQDGWLLSLDVSVFDTANVSNMQEMFYYSHSLTELNLANFNTAKVTNMAGMFENAYNLETLNISNFDTSKVTDMNNMFSQVALTSIDLSAAAVKNFTTDRVTNMREMFADSGKLKTITLGDFKNPVVTNMNWMFQDCSALTTINGLDKFGTSSVTMMDSMFRKCLSLKDIDLSHFDTRNVESMTFMFNLDTSLTTANISNWKFTKYASLESLFNGCTGLKSVDLTISTPKGAGLANLFYNCSSLTEVDISSIDMRPLQDQLYYYDGSSKLIRLFAGCTSLWKVTMGPNTILMPDTGLPDAPGNHTQLTDDTGTYINVGSYWQLVDDGGHHTPAASPHHPEGDLQTAAQVLATDKPGAMRTYVWQQTVPATVTIQYQDENQKELQPSQSFRGVVNDTYQVGGLSRSLPDLDLTKPTIAGYTFKMQQGDTPDGVLHSPSQVVTYVYTRTIGAPITVAYFDDTNQKTLATVTLSGPIGDPYQSAARSFEGYTLVASPTQPSGIYDNQARTLTYHYTQDPIAMGNLTINYQDMTGKVLATAKTVTQPIGTAYQSIPIAIDGYKLSQTVGQPNITFGAEPQTITYIYTALPTAGASITVKYVDTTGKQLADQRTLTGQHGATYQTMALTFDHYQLKRVYGNAQGQFTATAQTVTYEYQYQSQASLTGQDYTMIAGDAQPTAASFQAKATTETGKVMPVTVDLGKADFNRTGDYQVTLTAAKQTKQVVLHVLANRQNFTAADYTMTLGDSQPTVTDFKAQATDKFGQKVMIKPDFSQVDFTQTGRYTVTLQTNDGRTKMVALTLQAVAPTEPVIPTTPPTIAQPAPTPQPKPTVTQPQPTPPATKPNVQPHPEHLVKPTVTGTKPATVTGQTGNAEISGHPVVAPTQSTKLAPTTEPAKPVIKAGQQLPQTVEKFTQVGSWAGVLLLLGTLGTWIESKRRRN